MSLNFYCSLEIQTEHVFKNKTDKENYFFETNWFKIFSWELSTFFMKPSIADLTWNLFLFFLEHFTFTKPTDEIMKLNYRINADLSQKNISLILAIKL